MRSSRALGFLLLVAVMGCDPCSGVINCIDSPVLRVGGRVLDTGTGLPAAGVAVTLVTRSDGFADSVATTTGADGTFLASLAVPTAGLYGYDLVVMPPGLPGYRAPGKSCAVGAIRGSGCDTGPIGTKPYFPYLLGIIYRGPDSVPARAFDITFRQTAGSPLYGDSIFNGVFRRGTDNSGHTQLLGLYVFATTLDSLVGDIIVFFRDSSSLGKRQDSSVIRSVRLTPTNHFREGPLLLELRAGPSLAYSFLFSSGPDSQPVSGVKVRFVRTGGVATAETESAAVSDATGRASSNLRPLATGIVVGTLSVEPPPPWAPFSETITLATHDDDTSPVARSWRLSVLPLPANQRPR
jgi:hypothetical protein